MYMPVLDLSFLLKYLCSLAPESSSRSTCVYRIKFKFYPEDIRC